MKNITLALLGILVFILLLPLVVLFYGAEGAKDGMLEGIREWADCLGQLWQQLTRTFKRRFL